MSGVCVVSNSKVAGVVVWGIGLTLNPTYGHATGRPKPLGSKGLQPDSELCGGVVSTRKEAPTPANSQL